MNSSKKSHSVKKDLSSSSQRGEESENPVVESHSVKKDSSSSRKKSENPVVESHSVKKDSPSSRKKSENPVTAQQSPDGLRLRRRNVGRDLEPDQARKRVREMKKGVVDGSKLESKLESRLESRLGSRSGSSSTISTTMSSYVNEYFNDDEEEDLVIIDSDGEKEGRRRKEEVGHVTKFARSEKSELIELIYGSKNENSSKFSYHNLQNDESEEEMDETCVLNPVLPGQNGPKVKPKKTQKERRIPDSSGDDDGSKYRFDDNGTRSFFDDNGTRSFFDDSDFEDVIDPSENESSFAICIQVFIPFLIAGFGTVGAGLVLDLVQHWDVFKKITEVFILVPALLGLKGNLEMTLASRLSTQANLGLVRTPVEQWEMATGNIALIQCQAAVVAFLAACFAILMDWIPAGEFNLRHALLLSASSLLTASIASFVLGIIMILVVILSSKWNINPDNVATPIAASLGDLTTLALLANISSLLYYTIDSSIWICSSLILVFLSLVPVWTMIAHKNRFTREVLYTGWSPVVSAMAISSIGGCILDFAVSKFSGIAVFQPVINGVGGNLVAVQSSRISTYLHRRSHLGTLPKSDNKLCLSPLTAFCGNHIQARTARVLLAMVIPGHLIFTYGIHCIQAGHTSITGMFLIVYLAAALIQVLLLLFSAHTMILYMWKKKIDPDNSAIPYLTALGDFLGTSLLAIAFWFLYSIGDRDSDVGD